MNMEVYDDASFCVTKKQQIFSDLLFFAAADAAVSYSISLTNWNLSLDLLYFIFSH